MPFEVTFTVDGSRTSVTGIERADVHEDELRCFAREDGEHAVVSEIPLLALESITQERTTAADSEDGVEPAATITTDPSTPGAAATHTVALQVDDGIHDFEYFRVDYAAGGETTRVNDVTEEDVVRFGVDTDDDGDIEQPITTGDWSVSHGGSGYTLRVRNEEWDGNVEPGDDVILEYGGVPNPDAPGTYEAELILNGHQEVRTAFTVGAGEIHSPNVADDDAA